MHIRTLNKIISHHFHKIHQYSRDFHSFPGNCEHKDQYNIFFTLGRSFYSFKVPQIKLQSKDPQMTNRHYRPNNMSSNSLWTIVTCVRVLYMYDSSQWFGFFFEGNMGNYPPQILLINLRTLQLEIQHTYLKCKLQIPCISKLIIH